MPPPTPAHNQAALTAEVGAAATIAGAAAPEATGTRVDSPSPAPTAAAVAAAATAPATAPSRAVVSDGLQAIFTRINFATLQAQGGRPRSASCMAAVVHCTLAH